jgi:hypothetical protein
LPVVLGKRGPGHLERVGTVDTGGNHLGTHGIRRYRLA